MPRSAPRKRALPPAAASPRTASTSAPIRARRGQPPLNLPPRGLLHGLAHHLLEDHQQRLGCERSQPLERVADLRPVLFRPPRVVEGLPDALEEQIDEYTRHPPCARPHLRHDIQRDRWWNPEGRQLEARLLKARAQDLVAPVAHVPQQAELLSPFHQPAVQRAT